MIPEAPYLLSVAAHVPEYEVAIMRYARERGYPTPRVFEVNGNRAVAHRRADGNVSDKEKDRLTNLR